MTLAEHKAAKRSRRVRAVETLRERLSTYARAHGGCFLLFGSAARGTMRHDSDVDILVDFPRQELDDAWLFAEEVCRSLGSTPDIRPKSWCSAAFLEVVGPEARVLA